MSSQIGYDEARRSRICTPSKEYPANIKIIDVCEVDSRHESQKTADALGGQ